MKYLNVSKNNCFTYIEILNNTVIYIFNYHKCFTIVTNHWNVLLQTAFHQSHQTCVSLLLRPAYQTPREIRETIIVVSKNEQVGTFIGKNLHVQYKHFFKEKKVVFSNIKATFFKTLWQPRRGTTAWMIRIKNKKNKNAEDPVETQLSTFSKVIVKMLS